MIRGVKEHRAADRVGSVSRAHLSTLRSCLLSGTTSNKLPNSSPTNSSRDTTVLPTFAVALSNRTSKHHFQSWGRLVSRELRKQADKNIQRHPHPFVLSLTNIVLPSLMSKIAVSPACAWQERVLAAMPALHRSSTEAALSPKLQTHPGSVGSAGSNRANSSK